MNSARLYHMFSFIFLEIMKEFYNKKLSEYAKKLLNSYNLIEYCVENLKELGSISEYFIGSDITTADRYNTRTEKEKLEIIKHQSAIINLFSL